MHPNFTSSFSEAQRKLGRSNPIKLHTCSEDDAGHHFTSSVISIAAASHSVSYHCTFSLVRAIFSAQTAASCIAYFGEFLIAESTHHRCNDQSGALVLGRKRAWSGVGAVPDTAVAAPAASA